jgi:YHS domain-containing protein
MMVDDPVCGVPLDTRSAEADWSPARSTTYYFCSALCFFTFATDPDRYRGSAVAIQRAASLVSAPELLRRTKRPESPAA